MTPSEICAELLEQHAELRRMVDRARPCSDPACHDALTVQDRLREMLLLTVDAWAQARAEVMTDEHVREHEAFYRGLLATPGVAFEFAKGDVDRVLDALLSHMAHEEQAFLNDRVLRDDFVAVEPFGG